MTRKPWMWPDCKKIIVSPLPINRILRLLWHCWKDYSQEMILNGLRRICFRMEWWRPMSCLSICKVESRHCRATNKPPASIPYGATTTKASLSSPHPDSILRHWLKRCPWMRKTTPTVGWSPLTRNTPNSFLADRHWLMNWQNVLPNPIRH